jgi:glycosyltransferase involved in cell wall biosynthesis
MYDRLQDKIESLDLSSYVTLGGVSDDIASKLADSDIFLHTAHYEPFGLVLVEAMAAGLPVIALDGGGNRELIQNGGNGYIIDEALTSIFTDKIKEAARPENYTHLSNGAISTASQYDILPYVTKLLDLYANDA